MELQERDAREIVTELSKLLGTKLNIMNSRGFIIASSDEHRVGNFHAGAYEIIEKNLDSLEINEGESWEGAVPGQNFPIRLNGRIIGVVGITGEAEMTRKYGSIIRKMTEILVDGKAREEKQQNRQKELEHFLADWLSSNEDVITNTLVHRGGEFGIDITIPRRITALYIDTLINGSAGVTEKMVRTDILQLDSECYCFNESNYLVIITRSFSDMQLQNAFGELLKMAGKRGGYRLFAGTGPSNDNYLQLHRNYQYAKRALTASKKRNGSNLFFYNDLTIELVNDTIPSRKKIEFLQKIFHGTDDHKIDEQVRLLNIFYNQNGSLKATAAKLKMHPNTLQYRLNRIHELTGYDPRSYRDSLLFQMALLFYAELQQS